MTDSNGLRDRASAAPRQGQREGGRSAGVSLSTVKEDERGPTEERGRLARLRPRRPALANLLYFSSTFFLATGLAELYGQWLGSGQSPASTGFHSI